MHKLHATVLKRGPLTQKEARVLRYLCEGYLRKEIAGKVTRSESTISRQIESIALKLECHCAAEIVSTAVALGLVRVVVTKDHSLFVRFISVLLLLNIVNSNLDLRRGPRAPRPARTQRVARRVVRQQKQFI